MQFNPFGSKKPSISKAITGKEKKLLLVFADTSGSVDANRGLLRKKFYSYVAGFFSDLANVFSLATKNDRDIAVRCYLFDSEVAPNDAYHWAGDRAQNSNFILNYGKRPRKQSYGTSLNKVYETSLELIADHESTRGSKDFSTYIMIVCDGGTEDYDGAPAANVWQSQMKDLIVKLKSKSVTVVLVGQSDVPFNDRPRLPGKGRSSGKFYSQIHAQLWARYVRAKGFANDQVANSTGVISWFIQELVR